MKLNLSVEKEYKLIKDSSKEKGWLLYDDDEIICELEKEDDCFKITYELEVSE